MFSGPGNQTTFKFFPTHIPLWQQLTVAVSRGLVLSTLRWRRHSCNNKYAATIKCFRFQASQNERERACLVLGILKHPVQRAITAADASSIISIYLFFAGLCISLLTVFTTLSTHSRISFRPSSITAACCVTDVGSRGFASFGKKSRRYEYE